MPALQAATILVKKKIYNVILFTHGVPKSSKNLFRNSRAFQDQIGIWKCWFLRRGENRSTRRKTSRSRVENQQQSRPTYDARSGNRTRDTLVGGERSHCCTNPAPHHQWCSKPLVAMASGKNIWCLKFWQKSPIGDQKIKR